MTVILFVPLLSGAPDGRHPTVSCDGREPRAGRLMATGA